MKLLTGITILFSTLLTSVEATSTDAGQQSAQGSSAKCLSSSQVTGIVHILDSMKSDWSTLAGKTKGDLSSKAQLESMDSMLDDITTKSKLLKKADDGTACVTDSDSQALRSSSSNLLDYIRANLAHFYDLADVKTATVLSTVQSRPTGKGDISPSHDVDGRDDVDIASMDIDARGRGNRGRYQPAYPPSYVPGYAPAYQPVPQGYQPAYEPGYYQPAPAGYQPGGYAQPAPAQGGNSPQYSPNTGGYKYQGDDENDSRSRKEPEPQAEPEQSQPYDQAGSYQQPYYQPIYYPPASQESSPTDSQPNLNDKNGNFILRFAEHLTETLLYQLEVIGYEFGGRGKQSSKSVSLVTETKNKVLYYANEVLGHK